MEEEWKQLKEAITEAVEQTIGYQPRPDKRGWFDDECRVALVEKNILTYLRTPRSRVLLEKLTSFRS
jgi:hypothetical protein